MKNQFEEQYYCEDFDEVVTIVAKVVTKELVDHIFDTCYPDVIYFDETVEEFGTRAFESRNMGIVDLDSAKNVKALGECCFESAYNIDCNNAFQNVVYVGKGCFRNAIILGKVEMPKVEEIPERAFWNVDAYEIIVKNAEKIDTTSFKYSHVENGIQIMDVMDKIMKSAIIM